MSKLITVLSQCRIYILNALIALFGIVHWQQPFWLCAVKSGFADGFQYARKKPLISLLILSAILLAGAAGWFGYHWWQSRPQPVKIDFVIQAPENRDIENNAPPNPLVVTFNASVAPLAMVDKEVQKGISTSPAIAGRWHWLDDKILEFRPGKDWPVDQSFQVKLEKSLVAAQIKLARREFSFNTPEFTAKLDKAEFYQDPLLAALKKAVIHIQFSHPVDSLSLAKQIKLAIRERKPEAKEQSIPFTITYDKLKLNAFVHSGSLPVPRSGQQVIFTLSDDAKAEGSDAHIAKPLTATVDIPGLYNGLTINDVQLTVTPNSQTQLQDQILVLNTTLPVHEREMAKAVEVWLLPQYHPGTPESERTYNHYWNPEEVTAEILKLSTPVPLEALPAEHEYTQTHSFRVQADVGRYLFIKIDKDIKSFGGYLLPKTVYKTLVVPEFIKEVHIMGEGSLLSGEKKIALMARDLPGVKVEMGRVMPEQLQHFVSQSEGDFSHPDFSGNFGQDNLSERFEFALPLPAQEHGKPYYQPVDLSQYMVDAQGNNKRGIFLLTAKSYDPASKHSDDQVTDSRLIVVTDLGLIVKTELDGSQLVFVQSIQTGEPQSDAEVEVTGKNGLVLFNGKTDVGGKFRFPKLSGLTREREPVFYLVKHHGDMSFLPLGREDRQLNFSRFNIGGADNARDANQLNAYLFSDRGIYRPGDTFHIGIIVKTEHWDMPLTGLPLQAEILDARGLTVKRTTINLGAGGFNELSHETLPSSATGNYSINLYTVRDGKTDQFLGSTTVKVEEFQPDRIKTVAKFSKPVTDGWVNPDDLQAIVNVQNLYGAPAEARQIEASLTLKPALPAFKQYKDYRFHDPHYAKEGFDESLNPVQTDARGNAVFALGLEKYTRATYQLHFLARAFEAQGGRSVAAEADVLVSDMPFLIGYKADGRLDFVAKDAQRHVHLLAINPQVQAIPASNLTLELLERKVLSVLTRQQDNTYKYESRPKEISLHKDTLAIPKDGFNLQLDTRTPGDYSYLVRNADGLILSRIDYSVAGIGNVSRSLDRNAELQLTLDKEEYAPGEKIAVNIRAPYTGAGLITIERDKVYASVWFKAGTQASVQYIEVPRELTGNGYVSVQYIRDPGSDEIFMSPLSFGVAPFKVNLAQHTQALKLDVPELIKPGQTLNMKLQSPEPTRVVVFAIDEGILQVARYKNPDPLGYFFQKRQLAVDTTQILDLILPEFKKLMQMAAPGGDGEEETASFLNPFKRKHDKPAIYWSGIVDLEGEKEFSYQVPETFNGTLRVIAVAVNDGRIGSVTKNTQVRGDLIVSPNAPFIIAPGDEFTVSVAVANNIKGSGAKAPIQVNLNVPPQLAVQGEAGKTIAIDENHEGVVTFRVQALSGKGAALGNATLNFTASSGKLSASMHHDLSIRPATPKIASLRFGSFKGKQEVSIERQLYPDYRKVSAGVSPLPLVSIPGLTAYLKNFSYSCTEQLISKAIPILVLGKHPEFSEEGSDASSVENFSRLMPVLRTRQNAEGGFGLWVASPEADEFATVYAVHLLIEARANGIAVPEDMLKKSMDYIQNLASSPA
ncbi:MAG: alpha-2-macroglobulin, partial [Methylococcaceae bacterium]